MASKQDEYRQALTSLAEWDAYLLAHSGLPGPRANLELMHVAADLGDEALFLRYLAQTAGSADASAPETMLAVVGAVGLGRLLAEGSDAHWGRLQALAMDPRWRVREGVAMALQRVGLARFDDLIGHTRPWRRSAPLVQRALAAGLCEPALLRQADHARETLRILDELTTSVAASPDRRDQGLRVLRQALGYCWSVALVALPQEGWPTLERWACCPDPDVRWIVRENLKKARLQRLDAARVARLRVKLES